MRAENYVISVLCLVVLALAACGPGEPPTGTDEPDARVDADGPTDADSGLEDTREAADGSDADTSGQDADVGTATLYQRCTSESECPVGTGSCIKEVSLSATSQDGRTAVPLSEIFPQLADGEGICTERCTGGADACGDLSGIGGGDEAYTCQMVWSEARTLYPESPPAFPFDDQLDSSALESGVAFGAICRPPSTASAAAPDSMCQSCGAGGDSCGSDSTCWSLADGAPAGESGGTCLAPCGADAECPAGFACDVTGPDGGQFCRPVADTCGDCIDRDGDDVGTGRCGPGETVSGYDCDDSDPTIYYDTDNPDHPFPEHCGEHDYNCNGLSDAAEQIGTKEFGNDHCTACGDTCGGDVTNGMLTCSKIMVDGTATPVCNASCDTDPMGNLTYEDCNGRQAMDGCETPVDDPDAQVYADMDGDGYGDPGNPKFLCDGEMPSSGYVDNDKDCDDSDDTVYEGAPEACDDQDNDCDGTVDNGFDTKGETCSVGEGICKNEGGTVVCNAAGDGVTCDAMPGVSKTEICNGKDDDCDGSTDEDFPRKGTTCSKGKGVCLQSGTYRCNSAGDDVECSATAGSPTEDPEATCNGKDDDCDGAVDEGVKTSYYRDQDDDGYGVGWPRKQCSSPGKYWATNNNDCGGADTTDGNDTIYPGAGERCDGNGNGWYDNDCDQDFNEGCPISISVPTTMSVPKRVYSKPTSWTNTYECDDGYVVGNMEVAFNHSGHEQGTVAWVLPVCEPIHLYDPDGDSALDGISLANTASKKQYTKAKNRDYTGSGHDVTYSMIVGSDKPAEAITGITLEDHAPHPTSVGRLRAEVTELGIKEPYQTSGSGSEIEFGTPTTASFIRGDSRYDDPNAIGIEPPSNPAQRTARCGTGQVAVGIKVHQFDYYYSSNVGDITLMCKTLSLNNK